MKKNNNGRSFFLVDAVMSRFFFLALFVVAVIALIPSLRPEYSETEKRDLHKFPSFKLEALVSGEYFDDINLWYADTFPFRDNLINLNGIFKGSLNIDDSVEIHGELSTGDDIPDAEEESDNTSSDTDSSADTSSVSSATESGSSNTASKPTVKPQKPAAPPAVESLGAVLRVKDSAFEYYDFIKDIANSYASHINYAADSLDGKATVYTLIAPTSMAITLPDDIAKTVDSADQKKAIEYIFGRMNSKVVKVNPYSALRKHRNEYIYFRTDHHWTALGAYYSYCELMKAKGAVPPDLSEYKKHEFKGYLGSFYGQTKSPQLAKNPDTVVAYEPLWTNIIKTTLDKKTVLDKKIVSDGNSLSQSNKYLCFVSGDRPYGVINNPQKDDGSSCLIVKESFGNAMVPFFVANYQTIHVIDYRHISSVDSRTLSEFVTENNIKDVVFINNISATRNKALVRQIGEYVGK